MIRWTFNAVWILITSLLISNSAQGQLSNSWTQKSDVGWNAPNGPTGRFGAAYFSIGTKGYIGSGFSDNGYFLRNDFWEWDQVTNVWTQKASFGGAVRYGAVGFSIGAKGYIGTGSNFGDSTTYYNDFWEWDQASNSWTKKADFGGSPRAMAVGFSIGGKAYIGTGIADSTNYNDFWEWDQASDIWTRKADFGGEVRNSGTGFSVSTKGYIGLGLGAGRYFLDDFWEWDQASDTWTQQIDFQGGAREGAVAFSIGTKGYVGTGDGAIYYNDFWEWDPGNGTWTKKTDLAGEPRTFAVGFSIGSKGYIGAGSIGEGSIFSNGGAVNDFWEWDQASDIWTQKENFGTLTRAEAVSFSIGNKGYICTGRILNQVLNDLWEWDQATNIWTQKADFAGAARKGAVGFSIGNKGYIGTGGNYKDTVTYYNDFWEWNEATNTWTEKANFGGAARGGAVGFSIGTKGYIGTGTIYTTSYNDFWEWDQASDTWTQKTDFGGVPRYSAVGFSIGTKGYIGTGQDSISSIFYNDFWEWDQATNTWTQKANFGGGKRTEAAGFSIGAKGYIGVGATDTLVSTDLWEWDQASNTWTQVADFGGLYEIEGTGFSIGSKGYIGAGISNDFWEYTPGRLAIISVKSGNWNDTTTWVGGIIPTSNDTAIIAQGDTVTIDSNASASIVIVDSTGNIIIKDTTVLYVGENLLNSGTITGPGTIAFFSIDSIPTGGGKGGTFSSTIPVSIIAFYNLIVTSPITIDSLTIYYGDTLFIPSDTLTILGNVTLDGTIVGAGVTYFHGTREQIIYGDGGTISNMVINNPFGVTLDPTNITISNSLNFANGNINTGDTNEVLANYATPVTASPATGWINGTFESTGLPTSGDASLTLDIGDTSSYDPVDIDLHGLSGSSGGFRSSTTAGSAATSEIASSPLDPAKSLNRRWTISNLGATFNDFDLTLNYGAIEIPGAADQNKFIIAQTEDGGLHWKLDGGVVSSNGTKALNLIYNSDFIVGEVDCNKMLPDMSISVTNADAEDNDGAINLTTNNGYGPFVLHWYDAAIAFNGDTTINIPDLREGTYSFAVSTVIGGCVTTYTDTVRQADPLGIYASENRNVIRVYPNPAHGNLTIELSSSKQEDYMIKLADITGRTMIERTTNASEKENHFIELNLDGYAQGIYVLSLSSDATSRQVRIVVE